MKFMKLGSKPDQFQTDGDSIRYVATELATDMVVSVGDVKFYVHKFPLLSKSSHLQKLVATSSDDISEEIDIHDIPGGPAAFEICAKFCYGMVVTLNAYNVVAARCAAEYLEMYETLEKGNLVYKIDVFITSSIFRSTWKDSIIVLQTTKSLLPWSEELKIVSHCLDSIATRASVEPLRVDWSYSYNNRKTENGSDPHWKTGGVKKVPRDWWVEDLCELQIDLYKRVITTIRSKERVSEGVIGESLKAYALKRLPIFGNIQGGDILKYKYLLDTIIWLLPKEKNCVSCSFLLKLLQASVVLESGETGRRELMRKIAEQLDEATAGDLLIRCPNGESTVCDVDLVRDLIERFVMMEHSDDDDFASEASKAKVARLVDGYLAEAARDSSLPLSKFVDLAEMVSGFPRSSHDGIYRAIDMYLKEHAGLSKSDKKRICRLMDCRKLSPEACSHAVQNERLPLRVVVQVLFFEQSRGAHDLPGPVRALLPRGSYGSSRSTTTNSDDDWEGNQTSEELKDLKGELASLRLRNNNVGGGGNNNNNINNNGDDIIKSKKVKKVFSRLWSNKERQGENSSSDTTSESFASTSAEEKNEVAVKVKVLKPVQRK
ncbi:hypothetical protein ABFS82_12G020200 [Erythranthe guttata]|uniref:NPH3 domain-containing protein n=1 Tax=Erythranthe guttata TaxID=4155 RepID=A0A022QT31_ERYGU|nr:PREDICTED: BTB/POZ domain-containing protein NPY5-like [Erythranthe guttata]XP_012846663.1 PREDICTED: BTB/POZ domain-containing protein NPY5-like [Erythranthe guttata]XP_012846664.1 PREDICTED: BTB/POZ domain-containing protein NPY5-like [Erythranthe guttata]EYU29635.1 hypothetical protein MIMGU_mgv1a003178mg [Erythranthe guttata]|eukprot:XP_012846662.1 PREDICTED: BTB/POZ domain-containing protein NPY5-like [Erythranthe guttata]